MSNMKAKAMVSETGRLSIPAAMRQAMGIGNGGPVQLELVNGKLEVLTTKAFVERIQQMAREDGWHDKISVDSFLEWKREEARREIAEDFDRSR